MFVLTTKEIVDWICIIMIIFGSLGNSLGLIVFSSRKFRRTTYGRLALASLFINYLCVFRYSLLLHSETRRWITYAVSQSWFNCKLYRFSSCLRILSAFITVVWTYERFIYVTKNFQFFSPNQMKTKLKFLFLILLSFILIAALTGPTIYFYHLKQIFSHKKFHSNSTVKSMNLTLFSDLNETNSSWSSLTIDNGTNPLTSQMICGLKDSISLSWRNFLMDVRFGFNYTTFRSIFSEIIPSILVIYFNIGIICRVLQSSSSLSSNDLRGRIRSSYQNSFRQKDSSNPCPSAPAHSPSHSHSHSHSRHPVLTSNVSDGLIVHNRPRTSWMNIVLIMHSCLFFFSSLTATIVHWTTSDALLSYWTSVVILANCSLNFYVYCLSGKSFRREIRKLFRHYLEKYCFLKFFNLFRSESERENATRRNRLRNQNYRPTGFPPSQSNQHNRTSSFIQ